MDARVYLCGAGKVGVANAPSWQTVSILPNYLRINILDYSNLLKMSLEKDVKDGVKYILRRNFAWLSDVDIKKSHMLFHNLGLDAEYREALKPLFEAGFKINVKKKELRNCVDVEDLIDLVLEKIRAQIAEQEQAQDPLPLLFSMAAKLAKADGVITQEEVDFIENFMTNVMNMTPERKAQMKRCWTDAKNGTASFEQYAMEFYQRFSANTVLVKEVLEILFWVAAADKILHPNEERLLTFAANTFGLRGEFETLREENFPSTDKYYAILHCQKGDSIEKIKEAYRKLVAEFHPDKHAAKGLPQEMMEFAKRKFQEIQEAYEIVMREKR